MLTGMLSEQTKLFLARWFGQGHIFAIPGPQTGMDLLHHAKAIQTVIEEFSALNPGAAALPEIKQLELYRAALEQIATDILVLEIIPIAALEKILSKSTPDPSAN